MAPTIAQNGTDVNLIRAITFHVTFSWLHLSLLTVLNLGRYVFSEIATFENSITESVAVTSGF